MFPFFSIQPADPEGKTFTMTTVSQKKFECEDPKMIKRLMDTIKASGNAMTNLDDTLKRLGVPPTAVLQPISAGPRPPVFLAFFPFLLCLFSVFLFFLLHKRRP